MLKTFALLFIVYIVYAKAQGMVALLKGIENNHTLHMVYRQTAFVCKPYGIETLSELVMHTDLNSSCSAYLDSFRQTYPKEKFFAQMNLKVQQKYSVEGKDNRCVLYLSNDYSYSEALLEKGYAKMPFEVKGKNPEMEYRFKKALKRAKTKKLGIWSDVNVRNCFLGESSIGK